jgi:hypothetical protein
MIEIEHALLIDRSNDIRAAALNPSDRTRRISCWVIRSSLCGFTPRIFRTIALQLSSAARNGRATAIRSCSGDQHRRSLWRAEGYALRRQVPEHQNEVGDDSKSAEPGDGRGISADDRKHAQPCVDQRCDPADDERAGQKIGDEVGLSLRDAMTRR